MSHRYDPFNMNPGVENDQYLPSPAILQSFKVVEKLASNEKYLIWLMLNSLNFYSNGLILESLFFISISTQSTSLIRMNVGLSWDEPVLGSELVFQFGNGLILK